MSAVATTKTHSLLTVVLQVFYSINYRGHVSGWYFSPPIAARGNREVHLEVCQYTFLEKGGEWRKAIVYLNAYREARDPFTPDNVEYITNWDWSTNMLGSARHRALNYDTDEREYIKVMKVFAMDVNKKGN